MNDFALPPVVKEGFSLASSFAADRIVLKIAGSGDMETPVTLTSYLRSLHTEAVRLKVKSVVVDCEDLYFMSSACVKCLVSWLDGILKLSEKNRYSVRFRANANLHWQRRSFEALRRFAPGVVRIDP